MRRIKGSEVEEAEILQATIWRLQSIQGLRGQYNDRKPTYPGMVGY